MSRAIENSDVTVVPEAVWDVARRHFDLIHALAGNPARTRAQVQDAAKQLGRGVTQTYALLRLYEADPRLTTLLPKQPGPTRGYSRLPNSMESLIEEVIESDYLTRQRPRVSDLVRSVRGRCLKLGVKAPSRKAIAKRLAAKPRREVAARRHGYKKARDQFGPVQGSLETVAPLSLVQIDHTLVDVIVVDSVNRAPIQRPWLTLAIDVHTRCVAGFHLSLEPPSVTSVALCISHAVLPKDQWLAVRSITDEWPVHGLFTRLHLDNAKEFRSVALRRGCDQYGIAIDYRPVRTPHYGGHIERLIGTMMGKVHLLPGTTFSDVQAKGDWDPEKTASMTIDEVERWLATAVVGVYHQDKHSALGMPPLAAWRKEVAAARSPSSYLDVVDPRRFLIDFLPIEYRLIRREGVVLHSIHYWSDILTVWIGEKAKMIVRYDPRDLSRVFLLAPDGQYYDLPYRDLRRPPISLWEHRRALKKLREQGQTHIDEAAIFRAIDTMRAIADAAVVATKSVRRERERRLRVIQGGLTVPAGIDSLAESEFVSPEAERDERQPWERMLPVEEWE